MKKTIKIFSVILLILILVSCGTSKSDIDKAKENLWIIENTNSDIDSWSNIWLENEEEVVEKKEEIKKIEITKLTNDQFLELDDLSNKNLLDLELEITWKTIWKVDKIIVTFVNEWSEFPVDKYTLKQFNSGDSSFLYRAFKKYETMDMWKNVYTIEAYSWNEISKLQLVLNAYEDDNLERTNEDNLTVQEIDIEKLPKNATYWTPVLLWKWKISYSDLQWLEIVSDNIVWLTCDNITESIADKVNSWFFWNTCRPISWDEWISFFIVRLDWDEYVYEKHYYLPYQWIYWIQELERWTWVDIKNIWEKNTELKVKNSEYNILNITDSLFKEILK